MTKCLLDKVCNNLTLNLHVLFDHFLIGNINYNVYLDIFQE